MHRIPDSLEGSRGQDMYSGSPVNWFRDMNSIETKKTLHLSRVFSGAVVLLAKGFNLSLKVLYRCVKVV